MSETFPTRTRSGRTGNRRGLKIVLWSLVVAALLIGVVVGALAFVSSNVQQSFDEAEVITDAFPDDEFRPAPGLGGTVTILLLGSDTRGEVGRSLSAAIGDRSDAMILVRLSGDRQHVTLMSMMRDSWVEIPGRGENKINAALAFGGVPLAVQTVENLVGVRVDHVAIIDFEGFKALTDSLGGVTIDNQRAFTPTELPSVSFPRGEITLNGEEALAYVRDRMSFADGDFQRVRNQQTFLRGLANTLLTKVSLTNPAQTLRLVDSLSPYMARDPGLTSEVIVGVAGSLRGVTSDSVRSFTMPTTGTGTIRGQSVVLVDFDELEKVTQMFRDDTAHTYSPSN